MILHKYVVHFIGGNGILCTNKYEILRGLGRGLWRKNWII